MRLSRRGIAIAVIAPTLLATAACSNTSSSAAKKSSTLTISVWGVNEDIDSIKAAAKGFEAANPDIKLKFNKTDCGADYAVCKTLIAGRNMSDVLVTGSWNINQMANNGVLADLTDKMAADGVKTSDFVPVVIDSDKAAIDGRYHALPMGYNVQSLFFNTDMFARAGLAPPPADGSYTYDDLREWSKKLTLDSQGNNAESPKFDAKHIVQWGYDNRVAAASEPGFEPVLWAYGGGVLGGDGRDRCDLEKPGTAQALQLLQDMMWKDHTAVTPQMEQETPGYLRWIQGHVAIQQGSHEQVTIAAQQNPKLKFDMAALPKGPAGNSTLIQVHSWAAYAKSPNADNAWKFIKYMATTGAGKQMGLIPAYKNVAAGPDFLQAPGEPAHLKEAQLDPAAWPLARSNIDPKGVLSTVLGQDGFGPALGDIITGKKTAADALKGACAKVDKILGS
ncbi:ABC transporter substrate-binding protein [Streptomyces sp. NBC_01477]|uniref:ABC transporter substrate-binding protein n=1 Tax=Streptomyces sp. NBC_01477 TaxID=2976015 RepID=UPI002E34EBC7|nr:sugar ABC transporter substrate-binding protein [Streptomyces sp. NBC_01477]